MYGAGTKRLTAHLNTFKLARMRVSDSTVEEYNRGLSEFFDFVGPRWKPKTPEEVDYWLNQLELALERGKRDRGAFGARCRPH